MHPTRNTPSRRSTAARRAAPISTKNSPSVEAPAALAAAALKALRAHARTPSDHPAPGGFGTALAWLGRSPAGIAAAARCAVATVALLALAAVAWGAGAPRTIVVRGHAYAADGAPLAGARVMVRGTVSVSALTDGQGRYTLSVPLGMPAALQRSPFKLEVRAESGGKRLALAGGGAALTLEASWVPATGRVRVDSNRDAAAAAVATALEVEGVPIAWVDADFGGGAREAAPPTAAPPAPEPVTAAPARPAPHESVPEPTPRPAPPPAAAVVAPVAKAPEKAEKPRREKKKRARREEPAARPAPPPAEPLAVATPPATSAATDTPRTAPVTGAPDLPPPALESRPAPVSAPPAAPKIVASARPAPPEAPRPSPVRAIDPFAPRDSVAPPDTCRCTVRGTVEIDWVRPLEERTPVRVVLETPRETTARVVLDLGAPREFRFDPLPCGEYRLRVHPGGRLRYADVSGDSVRVLRCEGLTETRVVLQPVRK